MGTSLFGWYNFFIPIFPLFGGSIGSLENVPNRELLFFVCLFLFVVVFVLFCLLLLFFKEYSVIQ